MKPQSVFKNLLTAFVAVLFMQQFVISQEKEHAHKSPHGGIVASVGSQYHFELVVKAKELNLYVLDAKEKILPLKDVTGTIVVLIGKEKKLLKLSPSGEYMKAEHDFVKVEKLTAVATLNINGESQTGRFSYDRKRAVGN